MKRSTLALALLASTTGIAAAAVSAQAPSELASTQTWIHAGRVIAIPGQAPRGATTIVVQDGRIAALHDGYLPAPAGVKVIDLKSRTVLPGLIDSHTHLSSDRAGNEGLAAAMTDSIPLNSYETQWNGMKTLRAGFTTVRNLGDEKGKVLAYREAIRRGWVQGPRILDAGESISTSGGHMDGRVGLADEMHPMIGTENLCDGVDDCRRAVRRQIGRGADVIKFATTGGVNSGTGLATRIFEDEAKAIIDTAHAYGRKVAVHAHGIDGIKLAVRLGADSIEHGTTIDAETAKLMVKNGTFYVPTLSTVNGYLERLAANPNAYPPLIKNRLTGASGSPVNRCRSPSRSASRSPLAPTPGYPSTAAMPMNLNGWSSSGCPRWKRSRPPPSTPLRCSVSTRRSARWKSARAPTSLRSMAIPWPTCGC